MPRDNNFQSHFSGALHDCVEIIDLEPEQHTISIRPIFTIPDRAVVMFHFEAVQLKYKLPIRDKLFI